MRVALALSGQLRSFFESPCVLDGIRQKGLTIDCFCVLPRDDQGVADFIEFWKEPPDGFCLKSMQLLDESEPLLECGYRGGSGYKGVHQQYSERYTLGVLRQHFAKSVVGASLRQYEKMTTVYDWVIWSRYDLKFFRPIENLSTLARDFVYIPAHDNFGGYCDRLALGSSPKMAQYMQSFTSSRHMSNYVLNAEEFLKEHLEYCGIVPKRTRAIARVSRNGEECTVQWNAGSSDVMDPLYLPKTSSGDLLRPETDSTVILLHDGTLIMGS